MPSWDDLRYVLALHQAATLVDAAGQLRVAPTTVGRRVAALESDLGVSLFVRAAGRWHPTPAGERLIDRASSIEEQLTSAFRSAQDDKEPRGVVRISTLESMASTVLVPALPGLYRAYPHLEVHLYCTSRVQELGTGTTDIAVRFGRPRGGGLLARRLTHVSERYYAARTLIDALHLDVSAVDTLAGLPLVTMQGRGRPPRAAQTRQVLRTNSLSTVRASAVAGLGVALLPDLLLRPGDDLIALTGLPPLDDIPVWLVTHETLAGVPRVRAVLDFLAALFRE